MYWKQGIGRQIWIEPNQNEIIKSEPEPESESGLLVVQIGMLTTLSNCFLTAHLSADQCPLRYMLNVADIFPTLSPSCQRPIFAFH
jgi:hypothetical protein